MTSSRGDVVRVLLIEDNAGDARLLREMLRDAPREFVITHAERLGGGLDLLAAETFDVVLLDLTLPDSRGLDTFLRLHAGMPRVPVVVLSGTNDEVLAMEAVHRGAQDYLVKGEADAPVLVRAMLYAIERQRSEEALRDSESRYRSIVDTANEGVATLDGDGRLELVNPRLCEILGYELDELRSSLFELYVDEQHCSVWHDQLALIRAGGSGRSQYDLKLRHRDGSTVWALISASPRHDALGEFVGALLMASDFTQRKRAEEALQHQALHDALTGLPNRTLLHDRLEHAILQAERGHQSLALLLMDMDRFKEVNDAFGHAFGDVLLSQIGPRLQAALRKTDTVARLGGDEFAFLLPGLGAPDMARTLATQLATKLKDSMLEPFEVEGQSLEVGGSIGIALYPEHGTDWQALMRRADSAMYAAKARRTPFEVFASDLHEDAAARLKLTAELRHALPEGRLELYYQPKVAVRTHASSCVEALVRWNHPYEGMLLPGRFLGIAEQIGLIRPLGLWVIDEALAQCRAWSDAGLDIGVAVNLSMRDLHDPALPAEIESRLARSGVAPRLLTVEVTESSIMWDAARVMHIAGELAAMGVGLSIDDFGTGYSSLAYLRRLPVGELKIDGSFVLNMASDENDAVIVRSTIDLAHNLGLRVVAEGVESAAVFERLAELGCDGAQGFHLARPMAANACREWLLAHQLVGALSR